MTTKKNHEINYKKPVIIGEIGCNHMGDMEIAKEMITTAKIFCKADGVKFQKRTPKELLTPEEYHQPHPVPFHSYGNTYGEHREKLEFSKVQHKTLQRFCTQLGIDYSASVWDIMAAREITELNPGTIKIPSACNLKFDMLGYLCDNFGGEIHLSFGMTTRAEEKRIIKFFQSKKRNKDLVVYACTSGYPVPFKDLALLEIKRLRENYGTIVKDIGFSGHHNGIAMDVAAYTLGARYVERHFTLNRTWKGTDHAASLEPDGLRRVARDLRAAHEALRYKEQEILDIEAEQRKKLKRY